MLIGSSGRSLRKLGEVKRLEAQLIAERGLTKIYKEQVDSMLTLNKEMVKKLAAMGVKVVVSRAGVTFEAAK